MSNQRATTSFSIDDQLSSLFEELLGTETNLESQDLSATNPSGPLHYSALTDTVNTTMLVLPSSSPSSQDDDKNNNNNETTNTIHEEYQIRTLDTHNMDRLTILPMFPSFVSTSTTTIQSGIKHLLLSNVPSKRIPL